MRFLLFLSMLILSVNSFSDPFFGEVNSKASVEASHSSHQNQGNEFKNNKQNMTACKASDNHTSLNFLSDFEKLRLIGIVSINGVFRALFIDDNNQLYDIKEKQVLNNQQIEIKHITLKSVSYIDWRQTSNCHNPYQVTLKL